MKTKEDFKVGDKVIITNFEYLELHSIEEYFYKTVEVIEDSNSTPKHCINVDIQYNPEGGFNIPIEFVTPVEVNEVTRTNVNKFSVGDKVYKPKGYKFNGTIVSVFQTTKNETRVVAELDECSNSGGMLHIFNENQLELRVNEEKECVKCNCKKGENK